jgi:hypothetical protein
MNCCFPTILTFIGYQPLTYHIYGIYGVYAWIFAHPELNSRLLKVFVVACREAGKCMATWVSGRSQGSAKPFTASSNLAVASISEESCFRNYHSAKGQ